MKSAIVLALLTIIVVAECKSSYRNEKIVTAQQISRPLEMKYVPKKVIKILDANGINHRATKVTTDKHNTYIISNNPENGIHVTDSKLSNKWKTVKTLNVNNDKTIGHVMKKANGVGNGMTSYITSKTCIGTANSVENVLKKN